MKSRLSKTRPCDARDGRGHHDTLRMRNGAGVRQYCTILNWRKQEQPRVRPQRGFLEYVQQGLAPFVESTGRKIAMYLARKHTAETLHAIGGKLGGVSGAVVTIMAQKISGEAKKNRKLSRMSERPRAFYLIFEPRPHSLTSA